MTLSGVNVNIVCMTIWTPGIQKSSVPLYTQLADAIEHDISSGRLVPGAKLPTHRDLADVLGIHVTTITRGYKEAEQRGLIIGTVGRGTYISSDAGASTSMIPHGPQASAMIEMGLINPLYHHDPDLAVALKKLCRRRDMSGLMQYSAPGGLQEHRSLGAQWANNFGLQVTASDIVVCSGAQHALTCALSGLFRQGDRVATDCLTYPGMKTLSAMLGLRLVPVEMDESGMSAENLDRICRRDKVKGLYLMPGVHNPTTTMVTASRREALARVALSHGLLVIEDDAYDLTRPGVTQPTTALIPDNGIYIAGISKALAAGLRVAFMVVPPQHRRSICEAVLNTVWMTPSLNVELVSLWIKDGTAGTVIERKRKEAAERFALAGEILDGYTFRGIATGFFIWLSLPPPWRGLFFEQRMRELGVNVFGAEKFAVGDATVPAAARISLTGTKTMDELATGLQLIRRVLDGGLKSEFSVTM